VAVGSLVACGKKELAAPIITSVEVDRRTIVVDAQATGAVEAINVIEVKSKASGQITRLPVETGTQVKRSEELYKTRVITTPEYETAQLQLAQAQGTIVRATTNVDLAKQRLEDARVVAPVAGTFIDKPILAACGPVKQRA